MKINRRQFHDLIEVYDTVDNHDRQLQPERGEETKRYGKAPHRADISLHIEFRIAAGILDTAAARCAAIRQDAAQKADKLKTERMQKAKADLAAAKQSAETAAAAEQRTAQQETAALAEDIRKKAQQNSANVIRAIREAITG